MSRDAFPWAEDELKDRERWKAPAGELDAIVSDLVQEFEMRLGIYLEQKMDPNQKPLAHRIMAGYIEQVVSQSMIEDPQHLLDVIVSQLSKGDDQVQKYAGSVLNPLIQALYHEGHNGFILDYRSFQSMPVGAHHLDGTQERPMKLSYHLPESDGGKIVRSLGLRANNCHVLIKGDLEYAGSLSNDSIFYMHMQKVPQKKIGWMANDCSYYLEDAKEITPLTDAKNSIRIVSSTGQQDVHLSPAFFERSCILYIPDGSGAWQEVEL